MPIIVPNKPTSHFKVEAGTYVARCYSMIHIGTITDTIMGKEKRINKVRIGWELPTEMHVFNPEKGEQPLVISKEFNLSMNEKATLRKFLESWRGKAFTEEELGKFDLMTLLGKECMIGINIDDKDRSVISSVSRVVKGMEVPGLINAQFVFNYDEEFSEQKISSLPDFISEKIRSSEEYKSRNQTMTVGVDLGGESDPVVPDDLPF